MRSSRPLLVLVAVAGAAASGCAARAPAAPAPQVAAAADTRVECHMEEVTGSHFKTRVCLTVGQRALRDAHTQVMKDALTLPRGAIINCVGKTPTC